MSNTASARKPKVPLKTGTLAAHPYVCLMLLGSPPDIIHRYELRKDPPLNKALSMQRHKQGPRKAFTPTIADCGFKAPLTPRLVWPYFISHPRYYNISIPHFQVFFYHRYNVF